MKFSTAQEIRDIVLSIKNQHINKQSISKMYFEIENYILPISGITDSYARGFNGTFLHKFISIKNTEIQCFHKEFDNNYIFKEKMNAFFLKQVILQLRKKDEVGIDFINMVKDSFQINFLEEKDAIYSFLLWKKMEV